MKYLIVKTSSLGDILQSFPVASYLRQKSPYGEITWLVEEKFSSLVQAHPAVDHILTTDRKAKIPICRNLRKKSYDVLFDLQGNCKSGLLTLLADAKAKVGFSWKDLPEWPNGLATNVKFPMPKGKNIRDDYLSLVQNYFGDFSKIEPTPFLFPMSDKEARGIEGIEGGTVVCTGAAWPSKRLSKEQWIPLLEKLSGKVQLVWNTEEERAFVEKLPGEVLPKLSLPQLQNVMAKSKRVIALDSLPLHLCGTTATPAFAYFGPSSLKKFLPPGSKGIQGACPLGITFEGRCPRLRSCSAPCLSDLEIALD